MCSIIFGMGREIRGAIPALLLFTFRLTTTTPPQHAWATQRDSNVAYPRIVQGTTKIKIVNALILYIYCYNLNAGRGSTGWARLVGLS